MLTTCSIARVQWQRAGCEALGRVHCMHRMQNRHRLVSSRPQRARERCHRRDSQAGDPLAGRLPPGVPAVTTTSTSSNDACLLHHAHAPVHARALDHARARAQAQAQARVRWNGRRTMHGYLVPVRSEETRAPLGCLRDRA